MKVEEQYIQTKDNIKYLGFTLDSKMSFREHLRKVADKSSIPVA